MNAIKRNGRRKKIDILADDDDDEGINAQYGFVALIVCYCLRAQQSHNPRKHLTERAYQATIFIGKVSVIYGTNLRLTTAKPGV